MPRPLPASADCQAHSFVPCPWPLAGRRPSSAPAPPIQGVLHQMKEGTREQTYKN
jgi:hypothetical protein